MRKRKSVKAITTIAKNHNNRNSTRTGFRFTRVVVCETAR
jgi:hypothetical protein